MNKEIHKQIMPIVDNEGFDYTFCDYSDFKEIKDEKFHELRENFKKASRELKEYIGFYEY